MLDVQLFGLDPGWHHLVNVGLHLINTALLFLLLQRATGATWRSAFAAALFGLHPLHVESVAWISERKDVLSTVFWLLTTLAWLAWVRRPSPARYATAAVLFALGLMSKPMLVTLPLVLLLLDAWPLGRLGPGAVSLRTLAPLVREKLPLLALSAISSVITWLAQARGSAISDLVRPPPPASGPPTRSCPASPISGRPRGPPGWLPSTRTPGCSPAASMAWRSPPAARCWSGSAPWPGGSGGGGPGCWWAGPGSW